MTSQPDRRALLHVARQAIVGHVTGKAAPSQEGAGDRTASDVLGQSGAAFVTIHCEGELRGCIGHLDWNEPLGEVVRNCAIAACSADPRFSPVMAREIDALDIELSILGSLERVTDADVIEIGRHGLLIERGGRRGLLLPQVASERRWDRETFLAETCRKAGLPRDAWKIGASVWRFDAEVFSERDF